MTIPQSPSLRRGGGPPGPEGGTSVLANRDFIKLRAGETISLLGQQIRELALPLVAILTRHATALQVGVLNAARYAPVVVSSLLAGVWLDRRRRRPILIASDLACAVLVALIPLASVLGVLSIWLLCLIALLVGIPQVFFDIGSLSCLPSLVQRRHLTDANSKMQISFSVAGIAGPSIAGVLVGLLTAPIVLIVNALSCLVSMAMLLAIRQPGPSPRADTAPRSVARRSSRGCRPCSAAGCCSRC